MNDLDTIVASARELFAATHAPAELENAKARFLGKAGQITELMKGMAALSVEEKKTRGAAINQAKQAIEAALSERRQQLAEAELQKQLQAEALDVTLPGRQRTPGGLHPVTLTLERIEQILAAWALKWRKAPRLRLIGTTSRHLTPLKTTLHALCTILFTSKAAAKKRPICYAPTPAPCRCAMPCSMCNASKA